MQSDQTVLASVFGNGDVLICQAYGSIKVGVPSSALLNVQSEQLAVGREMSIYPLFPEVTITNKNDISFQILLTLSNY